jgi:2-hydroxychromene-2-carboxylate isomerase
MQSKEFDRRIDRLQQHIHSIDLIAMAERLAAEHELDAAELLAEAKVFARREMEIGKDAALQELADSAGIPVAQLLAEAEELGRAA